MCPKICYSYNLNEYPGKTFSIYTESRSFSQAVHGSISSPGLVKQQGLIFPTHEHAVVRPHDLQSTQKGEALSLHGKVVEFLTTLLEECRLPE